MALLARLIADWPQGCKWGPLISVPLLLRDLLPFLKCARPSPAGLAAYSADSDGWADATACCITPPPTLSTSATPCAPDIRCRADRLYSPQVGSSLKVLAQLPVLCVQTQRVQCDINQIFTNYDFPGRPSLAALLYVAIRVNFSFCVISGISLRSEFRSSTD